VRNCWNGEIPQFLSLAVLGGRGWMEEGGGDTPPPYIYHRRVYGQHQHSDGVRHTHPGYTPRSPARPTAVHGPAARAQLPR